MGTAIQQGNTLCYKGSNFLRQRLVLSVLSGKPIKITDIRSFDDEPGLKEYEVSLVRLLDKITNGTNVRLNETGTELYFQPGLLFGGRIEHDCSLERGIGYYLEALFMIGFFCKEPIDAKLTGVTNNNIDPSVDLIQTSMLTTMKQFILDDEGLDLKIKKRGMLPLGGGEILFKCPVKSRLRAVQIVDNGMVQRIRGTAFALRVSPAIANRMVSRAKGLLLNFIPDVFITSDQRKGNFAGRSPGFGIHLQALTTTGVIYSAERVSKNISNGEDPSVPEELGDEVAQRLLHEIYLGGITDSCSQPLAILNMALGPKDVSKIITGPLTNCSIGFLRNLKEFFGITFKIEHYQNDDDDDERNGAGLQKVLLTCVGIGYSNISKKTV